MEIKHPSKNGPQGCFFFESYQLRSKILGLGNTVSYPVVFFPDQWDSVFCCLVGNLLEVVVSIRPGFHFIGVAGGFVSGVMIV